MKLDADKMLKLSADSSALGGMDDELSSVVGSVQDKYGFGKIHSLSDSELSMVAGGVANPEELILKLRSWQKT